MAERQHVHLALFQEDQIEDASEALVRLRGLGVNDRDISVISGVPLSDRVLGRPMTWTRIGLIGILGALFGFLVAAFLTWGTPFLYPLRVGRLPIFPLPTSIVIIFELTMLGLLISTFIGVFVETITPSYGPPGYHPDISDGKIGILFKSDPNLDRRTETALTELGAELTEVQKP